MDSVDTTPCTLRELGAFCALVSDAVNARAITGDQGAALIRALGDKARGPGTPDRSRLAAALSDLRGHHLCGEDHPLLAGRATLLAHDLAGPAPEKGDP